MSIGIKVKVWGDYALFCRPEMKTERCSYDVMTPSAARGILDAIFWHPGLKWKIDQIYVNHPIQFTSIRRNEVRLLPAMHCRFITDLKSRFTSAARKTLCRGHRWCCGMWSML